MKRLFSIFLFFIVLGSLSAQDMGQAGIDTKGMKLVRLVGVHYLNRSRAYEGVTGYDDFEQNINNWGIGGTIFAGYGPVGMYSQAAILVPTGHDFSPQSPVGSQDMKGFRIGVDNLSGLGVNLEMGHSMGFVLGAGLHWSLDFLYKDLYYDREGDEPALYFDLGLGGSANFYILPTEVLTLYFGATSSWDFLTLHGNSYLNQNWDKGTRWIYGFNGGIGFKL